MSKQHFAKLSNNRVIGYVLVFQVSLLEQRIVGYFAYLFWNNILSLNLVLDTSGSQAQNFFYHLVTKGTQKCKKS